MLMRNTSTGQLEFYDISNNNRSPRRDRSARLGSNWSAAGFGDFSGNANETDMLMRNNNTGAFELYDISNNQITSAAPLGQVGLEWQVVGFGPINGAGASDMLMRNSITGSFEIYDITDNRHHIGGVHGSGRARVVGRRHRRRSVRQRGCRKHSVRSGDGVDRSRQLWQWRDEHARQPGDGTADASDDAARLTNCLVPLADSPSGVARR